MGTWYYMILLKDDEKKLIVAKYFGTNTYPSNEENICDDAQGLLSIPDFYYMCQLGYNKLYSEDRLYDYYERELGYKIIVQNKHGRILYPDEIEEVLNKRKR